MDPPQNYATDRDEQYAEIDREKCRHRDLDQGAVNNDGNKYSKNHT